MWDGAEFGEAMSFTPTSFRGESVIALWQGQFFAAGYGNGRGLVLDRSYSVVGNFTVSIENHPEAAVDFHEVSRSAMIRDYAPLLVPCSLNNRRALRLDLIGAHT